MSASQRDIGSGRIIGEPQVAVTRMQRDELLRALVMAAIADDYEDYKMIVGDVTKWAMDRGFSTNSDEIYRHLTKLIDDSLAKAYRLSPSSDPEEIMQPHLWDMSADSYFILTLEGKRSVLPIDDL